MQTRQRFERKSARFKRKAVSRMCMCARARRARRAGHFEHAAAGHMFAAQATVAQRIAQATPRE
eukprot:8120283-Alexandrium_andersonii.AAC.1